MSLKKIAEIAGVSVSTVSRILNDSDYNRRNTELRDKVLKIAREQNYVPNIAARNLKTGCTGQSETLTIAILVTRIDSAETDPFYSELIRNIERQIHSSQCILTRVIYKAVFSNERECSRIDVSKEIQKLFDSDRKLDGIIIVGKCCQSVISILTKKYKNIVAVNRNPDTNMIDEVVCDGKKVAEIATKHLISLGHRKIGYVGSCQGEARFKGFQKTLFKYNIDLNLSFIIQAQASEEQGFMAMERFMSQEDMPTGIYCANDIIAIGMLKYLSKVRGRAYHPSIISCDDIEESQYTKPMLTTVHLPKEEMAKFALFLLLDRIEKGHRTPTKIELQGSLVRRESCSSVENAIECEYYI